MQAARYRGRAGRKEKYSDRCLFGYPPLDDAEPELKTFTAGTTLPPTLRFITAARNTSLKLLGMAMIALSGLGAFAAETWLTITGDPGNSANHYIQVDPAAIDIKDDLRVIPVRINRARIWTTSEGVQFRSVETEVQIDCTQQTARYVKASFYAQPDFRGQPFKVSVYANDDIRPMVFKDIADNPDMRIIKAACVAKGVTTN